jgi:hypothetical protein
MTVKELIAELEKIEDKDLDVVISSDYDGYVLVEDIIENEKYYGKADEFGWTACTRKCITIF